MMRPEKLLERPRVLQQILTEDSVRLCIVKAAPGYGKSVVLRQLANRLAERAVLLSLTVAHGEPSAFEAELEAVRGRFTGRSGVPSGPDDRAHSDVFVLIDNYDAISAFPLAGEVLERFIGEMPENFHLVLAARERPRLALGQLRASRVLLELGDHDIAFTDEELSSVIKQVWGLPLGDTDVCRIASLTGGWITGATLIATQLANDPRRAETPHPNTENLWTTFEYFSEIVARYVAPSVLDFITTCSVFERLHPDVCGRLSGEQSALAILRSLAENSLFISPAGGAYFQLQPLFRAYLRDRLTQSMSTSELQDLQLRAAKALVEFGEPSSAIIHFLKAGRPDAAAELLEGIGIGQLEVEPLADVELLLDRLPGNVMREHPWLLALLGRLKRLRNEFDGAFATLNLAEVEFREQQQSDGLAWVSSEMNQVHYRDGIYEGSAVKVMQDLESPDISPLTYANLAAHLCWMQCETGPVSGAIRAGESALSRGALIDNAYLRNRALMRAYRNLALASVYSGNLDRALALIGHARKTDGADIFEVAWTNIVYAIILILRSELNAARDLLIPLIETSAPYSATQGRWAEWWLGNILRAEGRVEEAQAAYRAAGTLALIDKAVMRPSDAGLRSLLTAADRGASSQDSPQSALRRAGEMLVSAVARLGEDPGFSLGTLTATEESLHRSGHRLHQMSLASYRSRVLSQLGRHREAKELRDTVVGFMLHNRIRILPWGVLSSADDALVFSDRQGLACDLFPSMVETCPDPGIRGRLESARRENVLSPEMLKVLRERGLTWREIDIFCVYYLRAGRELGEGFSLRARTAKTLSISEHTLKSHITRIRAKLELSESREDVMRWVTGLAAVDELHQSDAVTPSTTIIG